jgi:TPR repeat protein
MRRAAAAVAQATGLARLFPSSSSAAAAAAATPSPTARLDQALADIAKITDKARQAQNTPAPSPLASAAADLAAAPSPPTPTPTQASLARTNRQLNESSTGAQLAALASALASGSDGAPRDIVRASKLWVLAAGKGDLGAALAVGAGSIDGVGAIPRDWTRAHGILTQLAGKTGHPWAHFALATLLLRRLLQGGADAAASSSSSALDVSALPEAARASPDAQRALASYRLAADSSVPPVPPAWLNLANCLAYGVGTPEARPDPAGASLWLRHAAARGDPLAAAHLAHALSPAPKGSHSNNPSSSSSSSSRFGVVPDAKEAAEWWRAAAVGGHPLAAHNLAIAYLNGTAPGCGGEGARTPDPAAALVWFRRAGDAGLWRSSLNAGLLLERGAGPALPRDLRAAAELYGQAAVGAARALEARGGAGAGADDAPARAAVEAGARARARLGEVKRKLRALAMTRDADGKGAVVAEEEVEDADAGSDALLLDGDYDLELTFESPAARDEALRSLLGGAGASSSSLTAATVLDVLRAHAAGGGAAPTVTMGKGLAEKVAAGKRGGK